MPTLNYLAINATPNQLVQTVINGQSFVIAIRQIGSSIYTSVMVDGEQITNNVRARNGSLLIPWSRANVKTAPYWKDTKGNTDPQYDGLGSRYLILFEATEDD